MSGEMVATSMLLSQPSTEPVRWRMVAPSALYWLSM